MDPSGFQAVLLSINSSEVVYQGSWAETPISGQNSFAYSTSINSSSVFLRFSGSAIRVIGEVPSGDGLLLVNYTLDGGTPKSTKLQSSNEGFSHVLFDSPILSNGQHTLAIDVVCTGIGRNYTIQSFKTFNPSPCRQIPSHSMQALVGILFSLLGLIIVFIIFIGRRMRQDRIQIKPLFRLGNTKEKSLVPYPILSYLQSEETDLQATTHRKVSQKGRLETAHPRFNPLLDTFEVNTRGSRRVSYSTAATLVTTVDPFLEKEEI